MTKVWTSLKECWTMKRFTVKYCTIWDIIMGEMMLHSYMFWRKNTVRVLLNLLFIFLIILDPLPSVEFESLKKACVAKPTWANRAIWEAAISLEGTVGFVLQPLGYRANTPSLKTLHSNHRITTHGTEMLFHTERKIIEKNPQYQGQTLNCLQFPSLFTISVWI